MLKKTNFDLAKNDAFLSKFPHALEAVSVGLGLMEKAFEDFQSAYYEDSTMYLLMCLRKRFKVGIHIYITDVHLLLVPSLFYPLTLSWEIMLTFRVNFKCEARKTTIGRGTFCANSIIGYYWLICSFRQLRDAIDGRAQEQDTAASWCISHTCR